MPPSNKNTRPQMDDPNQLSSGTFSNIINVSVTSNDEVFLDFGVAIPNTIGKTSANINLVSRIILTKKHAMDLNEVLMKSLAQ